MGTEQYTNFAISKKAISVALCTYNGERFLPRQLSSIAAQTRLPDEMVICDDGSTDHTVAMLRRFAAEVPFPVRIHVNERNLGSSVNFENAILQCQGDLIALCDQDDIWFSTRLERCEAEFAAHSDLGLVFSDGLVIDEHDQPTGSKLLQNFHFSAQTKAQLLLGDYLSLVRYRFITGATVMFRARLREYCFPVRGEWLHDGWIATIIATLAQIRLIEEPLIYYRKHAAQQVGTGPGEFRKRKPLADVTREHWMGIDWHRNAIEEIESAIARIPPASLRVSAGDFQRQREFLRMRLLLPRKRYLRPLSLLPFLKEYGRRASGWASVLTDLLLAKRDSEVGVAAESGFSALRPNRTWVKPEKYI